MDGQRIQDYLYLIQELLRCSPGREEAVLSDNPDLLDAGLVEMMKQMAAAEKNLKITKRLNALANQVEEKLNSPSRGDREKSVNKDKLNFLFKVLKPTRESQGNPIEVYPILQRNLAKLDDNLATVLRTWATARLSEVGLQQAQRIAATIGNFSYLIAQFPLGNKASNMEIAIAGYETILKVFSRNSNPEAWAKTQGNLGAAYWDRIRGDKAENLEKAIAAFQQALSIYTKEAFPTKWAMIQNNLGAAYFYRILGDRTQNLENAISCYSLALEIYTKENFPFEWAKNQNDLGVAYCERMYEDRAQNQEDAIHYFTLALSVYTKEEFPIDWATSQNNLGNAYRDRIRGDRTQNQENAIHHFTLALSIRTKEDSPVDWAATQNNLGTAYLHRIGGDRAQNLENAIDSIALALSVYTKENSRVDWAKTQNNLGVAYFYRILGDRAQNLENAIRHFTLALSIRTKEDFPIDWAETQNNLGTAYLYRISGDRAQNLENAIDSLTAVFSVYTTEDFPVNWATTQNNLGTAYSKRIDGDRTQNLELAIAAYQNALAVYTPNAHPVNCLKASRSLGNLHFTQSNWQCAIDAYEKAIIAVELSRSWAMNDDRRQQIMAEAIEVYQKLVQAYINTEQWDKAIQTVERSKARNLVELLANRDLYPKKGVPEEIIAQLDELRRNIPSLERQLQVVIDQLSGNMDGMTQRPSLEESQKRLQQELQQSRQQLDEVLNQIKPLDPSFSLTQKVETIRFEEIQSLVGEQTAMIQWYITGDKILTFIITQSLAIDILQSETTDLEALNNWLDEYLQDYDKPTKKHWSDNLPSRLQQLAEILHLEEILKQLPDNCQQVILVPHRLLHLLPLHALPLPNQPNKCLLDKFPQGVRYNPSCQLLQLTQDWERSNFSKFFGIQNPTKDLTYANLQVETIRQQFHPTEVLVETAATKTELMDETSFYKKFLRSAHCVHFACHGDFDEKSPLYSCLKLANDERLTLGEIFSLNINQCRLVALSACETGLTDRKSVSDEYIGLPSGFLFAGSPTVINSLWKVDELATAFLTIKFYENLQKYPQREAGDMAIALNQAQVWLRDLTHEYFETCLNQFKSQIEEILASLPTKGKRLIAKKSLEKVGDRQPRPFASPFYWSGFIATGR